MKKEEGESQESRINKTITLRADRFKTSHGIFNDVHAGKLTQIVQKFNQNQKDPNNEKGLIQSKNDILQLLMERDELGRTPFDIACYLGFKNIALYLLTKMGTPADVINQEINIDVENRNSYHSMCYRGNYDCTIILLNIERVYLKKTLYDQLIADKNKYRFKNMDIKHGHLSSQIFHDSDSIKRHEEFNQRVFNLFQKYSEDIIDRYRKMLTVQDKYRRNPIHYSAMSKQTKCFKTAQALLDI